MNKAEQYLKNISVDQSDFARLRHDLSNLLNDIPKINILYGSGNNGKTTFTNTLKRHLGDRITTIPSNLATTPTCPPTISSWILGKDYIVIQECDLNNLNPQTLLMLINGSKDFIAKTLYQSPRQVEVKPKHIIIETNQDPIDFLNDNALNGRINFIPFNKTIQNRDMNLVNEMLDNPGQLLNFIG